MNVMERLGIVDSIKSPSGGISWTLCKFVVPNSFIIASLGISTVLRSTVLEIQELWFLDRKKHSYHIISGL